MKDNPMPLLHQMLESLIFDPGAPADIRTSGARAWFDQSWADPKGFFKTLLKAYQKTRRVTVKSVPYSRYDFIYDIFEKQNNPAALAFIRYDANGRCHRVTYGELKQLADRRTEEWAAKGILPGNCVCLVYPVGLEFTVSLLAALKLGLVISLAPPGRPYLMKRQLWALDPDYIATSPVYADLVDTFRDKMIHTLPTTRKITDERSRIYESGQPALRIFDVSSETVLEPKEIPCDTLYLNAARDGVIALNLTPGDILSAPGFSAGLTQPFLLLSVLFSGAAFMNLTSSLVGKLPQMPEEMRPTVMGITPEFRDLPATRVGEILKRCRFWFRAPAGPGEIDQWQAFITQKNLGKTLTGVIKYHPQAGGVLALSRRCKGITRETLLPSPGMSWQIVPLPEGGMLPSQDFGRMAVQVGQEERMTPYLFVKNKGEWVYPASYPDEVRERFYTRELVADFIRETRFKLPFMVMAVHRAGATFRTHDLVIFSGSRNISDPAGLAQKLKDRISRYLGSEYCPNRVEFLPILPRLARDGSVDAGWCMKAYATNRLNKLAGHPVFKGIARLKDMMLIQTRITIKI
ncbi:AMP-binding protein [Desulfobacter vibrioformis]|uniref:AMP-binding protein n=1 Tax=Desulfobacter vibrioformis TaxID=34031 RepID=UPI0012EBD7F0|nr:AMP-binding protein [Desulfobacter vibrioformis]